VYGNIVEDPVRGRWRRDGVEPRRQRCGRSEVEGHTRALHGGRAEVLKADGSIDVTVTAVGKGTIYKVSPEARDRRSTSSSTQRRRRLSHHADRRMRGLIRS
jgi:hypothetical protein